MTNTKVNPTKVGIIGCGNISGIYLKNGQETFEILEIAACADLIPERAKAQAEAYGVARACSVDNFWPIPRSRS